MISDLLLVFENGESIKIAEAAIKQLWFHEDGTSHSLVNTSNDSRSMHSIKTVSAFRLRISTENPDLIKFENAFPENNEKPLDRLSRSSDIATMKLENTEYSLPWEENDEFFNSYQHVYTHGGFIDIAIEHPGSIH